MMALRQRGFTMIELITVLIVVGILSAVAAARFVDRATFDGAAYTDQLRGVIRYGQKLAVAQNRNIYVRLNGASVSLCFANEASCSAANRVPTASGSNSRSYATVAQCDNSSSWACEGSPSGVAYTAPASAALFYFDAFGKPYSGAAAAGTMTVTVTDAHNVRSVVIEAETGYVH